MNEGNGSSFADDLEDLDEESRAALEETRSIILLLQVQTPLDILSHVRTQRCFNVYTTFITLGLRRINVRITLCAYWVSSRGKYLN